MVRAAFQDPDQVAKGKGGVGRKAKRKRCQRKGWQNLEKTNEFDESFTATKLLNRMQTVKHFD